MQVWKKQKKRKPHKISFNVRAPESLNFGLCQQTFQYSVFPKKAKSLDLQHISG